MYCKNCGQKLEDSAKFCASCGTKTEQETQQQAPKQFGYDKHVDQTQNAQISKTAFRGKQWNSGTSGKVQFRSGQRKGGLLGRLFKFAIIAVVVIVVLVLIFGSGCDGVCAIETATGVDYDTYEPVNKTDEFVASDSIIYLTFYIDGYDTGTRVDVTWVYLETDPSTVIANDLAFSAAEGVNNVYFELSAPTGGWPTGEYEVEIYVDGSYVDSAYFDVVE